MDDLLRDALAPVLRDLAGAGLATPRFEALDRPADWGADTSVAMMWAPDGSGQSVCVAHGTTPVERVAAAADQVQEWAIEHLLRGTAATNWPPCPAHPNGHPLQPVAADGVAAWTCPRDHLLVAAVGTLGHGGAPAHTAPRGGRDPW